MTSIAFKDLNINTESEKFTGNKIDIDKLFNVEIEVLKYRVTASKYYKKEGSNKRLDIQIKHDDKLKITWTSSSALINTLDKIDPKSFPFKTTIVKNDDRSFQFT